MGLDFGLELSVKDLGRDLGLEVGCLELGSGLGRLENHEYLGLAPDLERRFVILVEILFGNLGVLVGSLVGNLQMLVLHFA